MASILPAVLLVFVLSGQAEKSPPVTVVAIGELAGPLLRQLARVTCGPYFTSNPTDRFGGGMIHFGIARGDIRKYDADPTNDHEVVAFLSGQIRPRLCEECRAPIARQITEKGQTWVELLISPKQLELSTCLSHLKPQK